MSTSLKRLFGTLIVGVALSLAVLAVLPGMAEAQDTRGASTGVNQNTTDENAGAPGASSRLAPEPSTRLVVSPGDSLWSVSQEQIGPDATPQQIAYEVERIFELNRDRIGEDPNLIFLGQELLVPPVSGATAAPEEPVAAQRAPEPIVVESESVSDSPAAEDAGSPPLPDPTDEQDESAPAESAPAETATSIADSLPESYYDDLNFKRRLLGLGILALTLIVAILIAWKLPMRRDVEGPTAWGVRWEYYENYALPEAAEGLEGESDSVSEPIEEATPELGSSSPTRSEDAMPASDHEVASQPVGPQEHLRSAHQLRRIPQGHRPTSR